MATVKDLLSEAQLTFEKRNEQYGAAYLRHGKIMKELYPQGLHLESLDDFTRFGLINMIVSKVCRYVTDPKKGHADSSYDMGIYAMMLTSVDSEVKEDSFAPKHECVRSVITCRVTQKEAAKIIKEEKKEILQPLNEFEYLSLKELYKNNPEVKIMKPRKLNKKELKIADKICKELDKINNQFDARRKRGKK